MTNVGDALMTCGIVPTDVVSTERLTGGTYNDVHRVVLATGERLVLKIAPDPAAPALTHERDLLRTEALFYRHAISALPVPRVVHPGDRVLLMTECPGTPWWGIRDQVDARRHARLRAQLGRGLAALHRITGPGFGYPQLGLTGTWSAAFEAMVDAIAQDADRYGVDVPAARLVAAVRGGRSRLDAAATPTLVHFDLWPGNLLVTDGELTGVIDGERAFWGDPVAELASLGLFDTIEDDSAFARGYREAGGELDFTAETQWRLAAYRSYLYLIMLIEGGPRGYHGPNHDAHCARTRAKLRDALALLDET